MAYKISNSGIGSRIKKRRTELGLTIKSVSDTLGVSESTLRDWENGRKISGEPYMKLAEILQMPVIKLISEHDLKISELEKEINGLKKSVKNIEKLIIPFI